MDDLRIGRIMRALRRRRGWRQVDLAGAAGVSQASISRMERGHFATLSQATITRVFATLDARYEGIVLWRGGEIDRLLDRDHSTLVTAAAERYRAAGWTVLSEVTYSHYGERGSIDLLAVRSRERAVAVNEMKTELVSLEATLRKHDEKVRLAANICAERFGWRPFIVGRVLVVREDRTIRRTIVRHAAIFGATYPLDTRSIRRWLRAPTASVAGIWFLPLNHGRTGSQAGGGRSRIRRRGLSVAPLREPGDGSPRGSRADPLRTKSPDMNE